jgi:transcription initiation factor TFIIA small subunit
VTLTDALDDLIGAERIDPQLAMKVLTQFDRIVAESLNEKVKARLTFKVNNSLHGSCSASSKTHETATQPWRLAGEC